MQDKLTRIFAIVVGVLRIGNIAILIAAALALVATFLWSAPLIAHLDRGYGAAGGAALVYMRIMIVSCLPMAYIVERLFRALAQILATLRTGDAFASANAKRLQLIG